MHDKQVAAPDNTAVRVALWRALHLGNLCTSRRILVKRNRSMNV
jgi:hypothetical protein